MDCGGVFVKYVLFIFNILFVVCGILLIVLGSIMLSKMGDLSNLNQAFESNSVAIVIIVLGSVVFFIAFLGCCGAIRENSCSLTMYAIIMLGMFVCQIALIAYVWIQRPQILESMDKVIAKIWEQRKTDQTLMDALQISFQCCGYHSFADYGLSVPNSCCGASSTSCSIVEAMTKPNCSRAFNSFWSKNIDIIRFAGLGVAAIELVAFIFGTCLANQVRNNVRRTNY